MKKLLLAALLLCGSLLCNAQADSTAAINTTWFSYANDTNLTLQQITRICDSQFTSAGYVTASDADSGKDEDGTPYVDYLRWKSFWGDRYDVTTGKLHDFVKDAAARLTGGLPPTNCGGTSTLQTSLTPFPSVTKGWEFIGPQNIIETGGGGGGTLGQHIGEVTGIVVNKSNPSEIYATGTFGSLWKTSNANLAPNNTWTCLSDHLPIMGGIGITNLYVDFSSTPHHLYCLAGIPPSICIKNPWHTVGIFYSADDGATFSQLNISSAIPDLVGTPILAMQYWPGSTGSTKYLFICTQFKIFRLDVTNPSAITSTVIKDMTGVLPADDQNDRFHGFSGIGFQAADPTVMYVSTSPTLGSLNATAGLYRISSCNTCSSCALSSMTIALTTATAPDYLQGSGTFVAGATKLPSGWYTTSAPHNWNISAHTNQVEVTPQLSQVSSMEVAVAGSYLDNLTYTGKFTLYLPAHTEVDVVLKDVKHDNKDIADWGTSIVGPTPGAIAGDYYVGPGYVPAGSTTALAPGAYVNDGATPIIITDIPFSVTTTHFVDRLEFGTYQLSGYSGTDRVTLSNVFVYEPYQDAVLFPTSPSSNNLFCVTNTLLSDHTEKYIKKIQDAGGVLSVTSYNGPSDLVDADSKDAQMQFQVSTTHSNIVYINPNQSNYNYILYKLDMSTGATSPSTTADAALHVDSRSMFIIPNSSNSDDIIYLGEDGGIGVGSFSGSWQNLNGTGMHTSYSFDIGSSQHNGAIGTAASDNGGMVSSVNNFNQWSHSYSGDGGQMKYGKRYATRNVLFYGWSGSSGFLSLNAYYLSGIPSAVGFGGWGGLPVDVPTVGKLVTTYNGEYYGTGVHINHNPNEACSDCNVYSVKADLVSGSYNLSPTPLTSASTFKDFYDNVPYPVQAVAPDMYDPNYVAAYMQRATWDQGSFAYCTNATAATPTWNVVGNHNFIPSGTDWTPIICMAVDPRVTSTGKRLWAGGSGYVATAEKDRVFQTSDGGGNWADMSYGLPTGPVNALVYDEQSHYLFAGTDQGVYAFNVDNGANSSSNPWVCYSLNLPNSFVTGLDINRCTGKLYVSTYGRGAYQAELPPDPNATGTSTTHGANGVNDFCDIDYISSNTTWTQDRDEVRTVYVPANVTLTIQNCIINMGRDKSIIVAPKGKLIVDGATITNGCGYMWKGIEARGDITKAQYASNQSTVIIKNNSLIQYAQTAVTNWNASGNDYNSSGGIIQVSNSTFNNNHIAASFAPYKGTYLGTTQRDFSYFTLDNFTIDNNYRDYNGAYPFLEHAAILRDDGVTFSGCNFSNSKSSGNGIYAMDAGVNVLPYYAPGDYARAHPTHSQFTGFVRGVDAEATISMSPVTSIDFADFNSCSVGVFVSVLNNTAITRCSFNVGLGTYVSQVTGDPCPQNIGIYMKNANTFTIEQNTFTGHFNSALKNYGVVVENSNYYNNSVYRSNFSNLDYGCFAIGYNGSGTTPGLHFVCNAYSGNTTDIGIPASSSIPTQGSMTTGTGNTFAAGTGSIVDNGTSFAYYYAGTNARPASVSSSVFLASASQANSCASTFGDPALPSRLTTSSMGTLKAAFKMTKSTWQGYNNQYNSLMDGGCTNCLVSQIQGNSQGIYNTLMNDAPYLSYTVLTTAGAANHFSYSQYYNLLYACPEALRNNDLLTFVQYNIPNPISQQDIINLKQRSNTNTARTTLESQCYDTHTLMSQDANGIMRALKVYSDTTWLGLNLNSNNVQYDTTSTYQYDSVGVWLQNIGDLTSQYQLVGYNLYKGNTTAATTALTNVPSLFQLNSQQTAEYNDFTSVFNILKNMQSSSRNLAQLTSGELSSIYSIGADSSADNGRIIAANIINFGGGIGNPLPPVRFYPFTCVPLQIGFKQPEPIDANAHTIVNNVKAYPNPAKDKVTFSYDITDMKGTAHLVITDIVGEMKVDIVIDNNHGYIDWSTDKIPSGVYIYRLSDANKIIGTGKLTVIK